MRLVKVHLYMFDARGRLYDVSRAVSAVYFSPSASYRRVSRTKERPQFRRRHCNEIRSELRKVPGKRDEQLVICQVLLNGGRDEIP